MSTAEGVPERARLHSGAGEVSALNAAVAKRVEVFQLLLSQQEVTRITSHVSSASGHVATVVFKWAAVCRRQDAARAQGERDSVRTALVTTLVTAF